MLMSALDLKDRIRARGTTRSNPTILLPVALAVLASTADASTPNFCLPNLGANVRLWGDTQPANNTLRVCVQTKPCGSTGGGVGGVGFQATGTLVNFNLEPLYSPKILLNGKNVTDQTKLVGLTTQNNNGCVNIPVDTSGFPSTSDVNPQSSLAASITLQPTVATNPASITHAISVNSFTFTYSVTADTGTPPPILGVSSYTVQDGTYLIAATPAAANSTNFDHVPIFAYCDISQTAPLGLSLSASYAYVASGIAGFSATVQGSLISSPTINDKPNATCLFSELPGPVSSPLSFLGTNTCILGLSPGDPNCGGPAQ